MAREARAWALVGPQGKVCAGYVAQSRAALKKHVGIDLSKPMWRGYRIARVAIRVIEPGEGESALAAEVRRGKPAPPLPGQMELL